VSDLAEHVQETIQKRRLFRRGQSILVAVSGGLDSMVLLNVLSRLAPEQGWRLTVAHFNHQLRGRSSNADERFVRDAARRLGLPVLVGRADVQRMAVTHRLSIEMAARTARHMFFAGIATTWGIPGVAVAHHADDQVELFLLRLLRGAGAEGLAGMKWLARSPVSSSVMLARPFLDQTRRTLAEYARSQKIRYREDATNAQTDVLRNRVRHKLIPLLSREFQPALERVLLRQAVILGAESDFLNETARRWLVKRHRPCFEKLPVAMQRRCLQLQMQESRTPVNFESLEKIRETAGRAVMIEGGVSISRDATGKLRIDGPEPASFKRKLSKLTLKGKSGTVEFEGVRIKWKLEKVTTGTFRAPYKAENRESFDAHKAGNRIVLRHWQAGDRFQPLGMAQAVKLQDLFTNAKIPRARRHELLVATAKRGEIMWVEGLRPGERFKLDRATRRRINWQWKRA
jgi:tRNA(Ile)-lysidine synthase